MVEHDIIQRIRENLEAKGYHYEPAFSAATGSPEPVLYLAGHLGKIYTPTGLDPSRPVILTEPSAVAPLWRPFDRRNSIGWHNDFSTRIARPELSFSWIRREDPSGSEFGAWRVASVSKVIKKMRQTSEGKYIIASLLSKAVPFGYADAGVPRFFRIVRKALYSPKLEMRFYGQALFEGAILSHGTMPESTLQAISAIELAADSVSETFNARTGSLLIVDNRFSLHDRMLQTVESEAPLRQAWLCFAKVQPTKDDGPSRMHL
jgi:hypothetical protein